MKTKLTSILACAGLFLTLSISLGLSSCTQSSTKEFQEQQNNLFQPHPQGTPTIKSDTTAVDSSE